MQSSMLILLCFAGRPLTPHLIRASVGADGRSLDVEWHIVSYSPILEYKVQYKNTKASCIFVIISTCMVKANNKHIIITCSPFSSPHHPSLCFPYSLCDHFHTLLLSGVLTDINMYQLSSAAPLSSVRE